MTTPTTVQVRLQVRADTAANWTANDPVLLANELGRETDTGKIKIGNGSTAWSSLAYQPFGGQITNADIASNAEIAVSKFADGTARQLLQTDAAGTGVEWTDNVDVPGTLDVTGAATFDDDVTIEGDLTVNGTTTTIDTETLLVKDKNIELAVVDTPTDTTADGGGITLKGTTDKTINWIDATDAWTFSEHVNIVSAKEYRIAGVKVLDATSLGSAVVSSSLTSVGTIGTGIWQGTAIDKTYLDATLVSTGDSGTVTSTMIADGTIVDADVNASAAIAGTKISPDFGSQALTTTGLISANGKVSFPLGTAALPSLYPGTDTNTGIYSPGADQVAISTNGTGRLFVDASGNVGVGTGSPQAKQHVSSSYTAATGIDSNIVQLISNNGASGGYAGLGLLGGSIGGSFIHFGDTDNAAVGTIGYFHDGNYMTVATNGSERMRLDSSGRLGLGTSSPNALLDVNAGSAWVGSHYVSTLNTDYRIRLRSVGAATNNNYTVELGASGSGPQPADSDLTINTQTWNGSAYVITEKMRVTATGNVGIGTTSPGYALTVSDGTRAGFIQPSSGLGSVNFGVATNHAMVLVTNDTERARIDSSGRLLVGTSSSPSAGGQAEYAKCVVAGNTSSPTTQGILNITRGQAASGTIGADTEVGHINFTDSVGNEFARITCATDGAVSSASDLPGRLVFSSTADGASSPTERMRIDSDGALKTSTNGTYKFGTGIQELTHNGTASTIHLVASNTSFAGEAATISAYRNTTNDTYKFLSCIRQGFAVALEIRDDGDVYNVNGTYGSLSDAKLKENIIDAQSQWDDIRQLRVRNYNFKPETNNSTHKQIGVIAQEIEDVSPGLVNTVPDRDAEGNDLGTVTKSVNYSVLYMKAVKALQEAMERIEQLETEMAEVKAQLQAS